MSINPAWSARQSRYLGSSRLAPAAWHEREGLISVQVQAEVYPVDLLIGDELGLSTERDL